VTSARSVNSLHENAPAATSARIANSLHAEAMSSLPLQPRKGTHVISKGRVGEVVEHTPGDPDLPYKIRFFDDGTADWCKA